MAESQVKRDKKHNFDGKLTCAAHEKCTQHPTKEKECLDDGGACCPKNHPLHTSDLCTQKNNGQRRHLSSNRVIKSQMKVVIGSLEGILTELKSVVVDLRDVAGQIDDVTNKIENTSSISKKSGEIGNVPLRRRKICHAALDHDVPDSIDSGLEDTNSNSSSVIHNFPVVGDCSSSKENRFPSFHNCSGNRGRWSDNELLYCSNRIEGDISKSISNQVVSSAMRKPRVQSLQMLEKYDVDKQNYGMGQNYKKCDKCRHSCDIVGTKCNFCDIDDKIGNLCDIIGNRGDSYCDVVEAKHKSCYAVEKKCNFCDADGINFSLSDYSGQKCSCQMSLSSSPKHRKKRNNLSSGNISNDCRSNLKEPIAKSEAYLNLVAYHNFFSTDTTTTHTTKHSLQDCQSDFYERELDQQLENIGKNYVQPKDNDDFESTFDKHSARKRTKSYSDTIFSRVSQNYDKNGYDSDDVVSEDGVCTNDSNSKVKDIVQSVIKSSDTFRFKVKQIGLRKKLSGSWRVVIKP